MLDKNPGGLADLVLQEIGANPFERDGYAWAARPLGWYASALDVSPKTVGEWTRSPEFDRLDILVQHRKTPLLRIRKAGDPSTLTHCQRLLQKIFTDTMPGFNQVKAVFHEECLALHKQNLALFEKELVQCGTFQPENKKALAAKKVEIKATKSEIARHLKKLQKALEDSKKTFTVSPQHYGCLRGIATAWGVQDAAFVFKHVLHRWSDFMAMTKVIIAEWGESETLYYRYYEYPTIPYILLFNYAALEIVLVSLQEKTANGECIDYEQVKRLVSAKNKQQGILKERLGLPE